MKTRNPALSLVLAIVLALLPTLSLAQTPVTTIPGTITVSGMGTASVPAEEASVIITLGTDGSGFYDPKTGMPVPDATAVALDSTGVVDAIVAFGVPADAITVSNPPFMGEWGPGTTPPTVMIAITIPNPTVEGLADLLDVVRQAASADGVYVNQFGVLYSVADCRVVRQQARADAVANARMEAEDQAAALNTTVGDVVASKDTVPMIMGSYQPNSCTGYPEITPYDAMYMSPGFDPRLPAEVKVTLSVEVTFSMP